MAIPTWWTQLPYENLMANAKLAKLGDEQLNSEMEAGNTRSRPISTLSRSTMPMSIPMTPQQVQLFKLFFKNTLGKGTSAFTMPVWGFESATGTKMGYYYRTVKIIKQEVSIELLGTGNYTVNFTLKVDEL